MLINLLGYYLNFDIAGIKENIRQSHMLWKLVYIFASCIAHLQRKCIKYSYRQAVRDINFIYANICISNS